MRKNSLLTVQLETPTCLAEKRDADPRSILSTRAALLGACTQRPSCACDRWHPNRSSRAIEQSSNHRPRTKSCVRNKRKTTLTDQTTAMMVCGCSDRTDSIRMQQQVGRISASASSIMRMHVWASFVFSTGYFATLTIELVADA